jgi:hypothetical protein
MKAKQIENALAPLKGMRLRFLGRATNMLWIEFGNLCEVRAFKGGLKTVGQWAIHIQCPWRITKARRIVVAYHDYYYDPKGDALNDWDARGKNRFDHIAKTLNSRFKSLPIGILSTSVDDFGGFVMKLAHGYQLEVFPDGSLPDAELWRIFQPNMDKKHFVVK